MRSMLCIRSKLMRALFFSFRHTFHFQILRAELFYICQAPPRTKVLIQRDGSEKSCSRPSFFYFIIPCASEIESRAGAGWPFRQQKCSSREFLFGHAFITFNPVPLGLTTTSDWIPGPSIWGHGLFDVSTKVTYFHIFSLASAAVSCGPFYFYGSGAFKFTSLRII